jgi:hypothetical protein
VAARRLNRDYADAHYGLALAFKALGRTSEAISEYARPFDRGRIGPSCNASSMRCR